MWTETYHRFAHEAAFLAACDASGWPRGPDGKASPPADVVLDVVGPAVEPPVLAGTLIIPGAIDPRWHVSASWFAGTTMPPSFAAGEVIPERPLRMFAAKDPGQRLTSIRARFEARRSAKPDDPKLVPVAVEIATVKLD